MHLPGSHADPPAEPVETDLFEDPFDDDLHAQLTAAGGHRWVGRSTLVVGAVVLLVAGFFAGAQVQHRYGTTSTASTGANPTGFAGGAGFPNRSAQPQAGTSSGSAAAATTKGTVKLVDGTTLYLQTADGQTLVVTTTDGTTVQTAKSSALKDLVVGSTVTVAGSTGDGTVTATTVTAGP